MMNKNIPEKKISGDSKRNKCKPPIRDTIRKKGLSHRCSWEG